MGNLYLRDLKPELKKEFMDRWKKKGMTKLLRHAKAGDDIEIGDYFDKDEQCKVA